MNISAPIICITLEQGTMFLLNVLVWFDDVKYFVCCETLLVSCDDDSCCVIAADHCIDTYSKKNLKPSLDPSALVEGLVNKPKTQLITTFTGLVRVITQSAPRRNLNGTVGGKIKVSYAFYSCIELRFNLVAFYRYSHPVCLFSIFFCHLRITDRCANLVKLIHHLQPPR